MEQQILDLLRITLHTASNEEREKASRTIEELKKQSGYCSALCRVSLEAQIDPAIRHLATILLRSMIEKNWGLSSHPVQQERLRRERFLRREFQEEDDEGNVTAASEPVRQEQILIQDAEKAVVREQLLQVGLHQQEMKLLGQFALMVATCVKYDFPHDMPQLLSYLTQQILEHTPAERGATLVLEMIIHPDYLLDEQQMETVSQQILPFCSQIYKNPGAYSESVRKSMVMVLFSFINFLFNRRMEREDQPPSEGQLFPLLVNTLNDWMDQVVVDLEQSQHVPLRICLLQVFCLLVHAMPNTLHSAGWIQRLLASTWKLLVNSQGIWQERHIAASSHAATNQGVSSEDIDFNCGIVYQFDSLLMLLLEFLHAVLNKPALAPLMYNAPAETARVLIVYMQLTQQQMETYEMEEDQFSIAEQEGRYGMESMSVRSSAGKLLSELLARQSKMPASQPSIVDQILQGVGSRLQETEAIYEREIPGGWKLREAALYGCAKGLRSFLKRNKQFKQSFGQFLQTMHRDLANPQSPFLRTRALLCAAKSFKYLSAPAELISVEVLGPYHQLVCETIVKKEIEPQWVGAVLALQKMLNHLPATFMPPHLDQLLQVLAHTAATSLQADTLLLGLDGIISLIRKIPTDTLNAQTVGSLITCALKLWQTYSQDSYINSYVLDILQAIVSHPAPEVLHLACRDGVPLIQQVLRAPELEGEKSTAINLLEILISASSQYPTPPTGSQQTILVQLLEASFPTLMELLMQTPAEADMILSAGTQCLFTIFHKGMQPNDAGQCALSQEHARQLIPPIIQFASRMLSGEVSDMGCMDIGPLLSILLIRCDFIAASEESFCSLLHAVCQRVKSAQMIDVQQTLYCVIGKMICTSVDGAVQFLHSQGLLTPILTFWMDEYSKFYEQYIGKLSVLSFGHLLLSPVAQQLLPAITVQVPLATVPARVTRSASKRAPPKEEWLTVAAPTRLVQLLLGEFQVALENEDGEDEDFEGDDQDFDSDAGSFDEENEWDPYGEEDDEGANFMGVDDILDGTGEYGEGEDLSSILVKLDPLTKPKAMELLKQIIRSVANAAPQIYQGEMQTLPKSEREMLELALAN